MNESGGGGKGWRGSPGRGNYRGSPGGQWHSPRYRGNKNKPYSPRFNSGSPLSSGGGWHHQQQHSPYQFQPPFSTSTPIHPHHRPQHFRGGGRPQRPFNNSPRGSFTHDRSGGGGGIDQWISPQMWEDPWKQLEFLEGDSQQGDISTTQFAPLDDTQSDLDISATQSEISLNSSFNDSLNEPPSPIKISKAANESGAPPPSDKSPDDKTDELNTAEDLLKLITS